MTALIVGGDRIAPLARSLAAAGYPDVRHWSGRKPGDLHHRLPPSTRLVVLVVDQINHMMASRIRAGANAQGVPIVFCQRSRTQLDAELRRMNLAQAA